jgi:hypothetical protein
MKIKPNPVPESTRQRRAQILRADKTPFLKFTLTLSGYADEADFKGKKINI